MITLGKHRHSEKTRLDTFESTRRLFSLVMLPVGALACTLAWFAQFVSHRLGTLDFYFLPTMALTLATAAFLLWLKPALQTWLERMLFMALTGYLLLTLNQQLHTFLPDHGQLSAFSYWFFIAYLMAFITWKPRHALLICSSTFVVMLLLLALNLRSLLELDEARLVVVVNNTAQFYFSTLAYIVGTFMLAQLRSQLVKMQSLALTDSLTGIANRRRAEEILAQELSRAKRHSYPLAVILFDLDHFKRINDTNGHAVGDAVLRNVARLVGSQLRAGDHLARWGGEEFLVIAPELSSARALSVAERMRVHIARLHIPGNEQIHPSASFGIAFMRPTDTADSLIKRADDALYVAKGRGRNCIEPESPQTAA